MPRRAWETRLLDAANFRAMFYLEDILRRLRMEEPGGCACFMFYGLVSIVYVRHIGYFAALQMMETTNVKGYEISKLMLGTVQMGLAYGVSNVEGKLSLARSHAMLEYAHKLGINTLDTAHQYGDAEEIIGGFSHPGETAFNIITKFALNNGSLSDKYVAKEEAYRSVMSSMTLLGRSRIPVCLFHKAIDQPMDRVVDTVAPILSAMKRDGLIDIGGISVFHPDEVDHLFSFNEFEVVQVPYSVVDHRLTRDSRLKKLTGTGKFVIARSIFLQGLLLMDPEHAPAGASGAKNYIRRLRELSRQTNLTLAQLALSYVRDTDGIGGIVIGAQNLDQISQNVELYNSPRLSVEIVKEIESAFSDVPREVITPALWYK